MTWPLIGLWHLVRLTPPDQKRAKLALLNEDQRPNSRLLDLDCTSS